MSDHIYVTSKDKVPKQEHWAIFKFSSITRTLYTENDDTQTIINYEAYLSRDAWLSEIEHLEKDRGYGANRNYVAVIIKPAKVNLSISIDAS